MANPTTNFGWVMPTSTSLVTNLPADFNTFGQGVDTSLQYLLGGTTGQVLSKTSGTNMAFTWVTPTDQTPLTTKGDLFAFSTVDARLAVGANETRLVADSTQTVGLKYVADTTNYAINAKGDLLGGTAADTLQALTIGANDTVLTADSTQATGMKWATAASGNTGVGCALNRTTDQSIPNGTITQITFDSELFDTNTMHSTSSNPERITIATGQGGYYLWTIKCTFDTNSTGTRQFIPYKNGTRQGGGGGPKGYDVLFDADGYTAMTATFVISLAAGDYISMAAYQDSGGSLNIRAEELFQSVMKLGS